MKTTRRLKHIPLHLVLILLSFIMLMPFFWMVSTSFKYEADIFVVPPKFINVEYTLYNYTWLFEKVNFARYMFNTAKITVCVLVGQLITSSLGGYAFARLHFRGREKLFMLYLSTMMVPGFVTMVPSFILFRNLGMYDTHWPLILPGLTSAFGTFLLRQFFIGIPVDLEEAARIDGCNPFGIYWRIFLPLSKPAMTTLAIFIFNGVWNDYLAPLIYVASNEKLTLTVAISNLQTSLATSWGLLMAGLTISILPVLVAFLAAQDVFVKGITLTGMKA